MRRTTVSALVFGALIAAGLPSQSSASTFTYSIDDGFFLVSASGSVLPFSGTVTVVGNSITSADIQLPASFGGDFTQIDQQFAAGAGWNIKLSAPSFEVTVDFASATDLFGGIDTTITNGELDRLFSPFGIAADDFAATVDLVATPLPAALPLFATALAGLALFGRRRKRRAPAAA